jgi:glutamine amidotransferase-like uncharacterized protein
LNQSSEAELRTYQLLIIPAGSVLGGRPAAHRVGEVVATYPDGTPAVVQGRVGERWVILSGIHAEAPEGWRRGLTFSTPTSVDNAYAVTLIDAALHRKPLPHY